MTGFLKSIVQTALRFLPFRAATGLEVFGQPDADSPVLLTGNFGLTVRRLERRLKSLDCYLLVAPSGGINVWCAAAGNKLNIHSVVSVIKTSGIADRVKHRLLILPQLSAPGLDHQEIERATGWVAVFGPVRLEDIPTYIQGGKQKTDTMSAVRFSLRDRLEMAVPWAVWLSVFAALALFFFRRELLLPVVAAVWAVTFLVYGGYFLVPFRHQLRKSFLFAAVAAAVPIVYRLAAGGLASSSAIGWTLFLGLFALVTAVELPDLAPMHNSASAWFWERGWYDPFVKLGWLVPQDLAYSIALDRRKCVGCGYCQSVCPVRLYKLEEETGLAVQIEGDTCLRCGACILQCEGEALAKA